MTPVSSFNTFSVVDFVYRYSRRLSITVIELNWRLKILFNMYDQRQSLLIVNIVIYLIKTIKDILIEKKKKIHILNVIFYLSVAYANQGQ